MATKSKTKTSKKNDSLFSKNMLTRKINIPFNKISQDIKKNLEIVLKKDLEGLCTIEGYIQKDSIEVMTYSSGVLEADNVVFNVSFKCNICRPVEGMKIKCKVVNITKAGIKAVYGNELNTPVIIFIARDHNYNNQMYSTVKIEDTIQVRVIGIRYELNDENISILADLITPKSALLDKKSKKSKETTPSLVIGDELGNIGKKKKGKKKKKTINLV